MKIFVTASGSSKEMEIMQALGYKPVAIEWSDVLTAMQTRMIDAVPTLPTLALAGQYYVATKHMTEVNWVPLVGATVITRQAWEAIPDDLRDEQDLLVGAEHRGKWVVASVVVVRQAEAGPPRADGQGGRLVVLASARRGRDRNRRGTARSRLLRADPAV